MFPKRRQHLPGGAASELEPFVASVPFGTRQERDQLPAQPLLPLATDVLVERLEALELAGEIGRASCRERVFRTV